MFQTLTSGYRRYAVPQVLTSCGFATYLFDNATKGRLEDR